MSFIKPFLSTVWKGTMSLHNQGHESVTSLHRQFFYHLDSLWKYLRKWYLQKQLISFHRCSAFRQTFAEHTFFCCPHIPKGVLISGDAKDSKRLYDRLLQPLPPVIICWIPFSVWFWLRCLIELHRSSSQLLLFAVCSLFSHCFALKQIHMGSLLGQRFFCQAKRSICQWAWYSQNS